MPSEGVRLPVQSHQEGLMRASHMPALQLPNKTWLAKLDNVAGPHLLAKVTQLGITLCKTHNDNTR